MTSITELYSSMATAHEKPCAYVLFSINKLPHISKAMKEYTLILLKKIAPPTLKFLTTFIESQHKPL